MGTRTGWPNLKPENFIELLEVDRPEKLARHDFEASPPFLALASTIAAPLRNATASPCWCSPATMPGPILPVSKPQMCRPLPLRFRTIRSLPDGTEVTLAFSLAFAQSPDMPEVAFFVCENRAQEAFWKSGYQSHANGATGIAAVYLASPAPERDAAFVGKMFGGDIGRMPGGGFRVACGPSQELHVLTPQDLGGLDRSLEGLDRREHAWSVSPCVARRRGFYTRSRGWRHVYRMDVMPAATTPPEGRPGDHRG